VLTREEEIVAGQIMATAFRDELEKISNKKSKGYGWAAPTAAVTAGGTITGGLVGRYIGKKLVPGRTGWVSKDLDRAIARVPRRLAEAGALGLGGLSLASMLYSRRKAQHKGK
jgi:hypothetical protein